MPDVDKTISGLTAFLKCNSRKCDGCEYQDKGYGRLGGCRLDQYQVLEDAIKLLKEQEAIKPKTIPEELKLKMWNALYAKEDEFEKKYIRTKEQNSWFLIYRSWLQEGFNLAIKAIADWEGG